MSFLDFFRQKPVINPLEDIPDSPEDWAAGDIAVCQVTGWVDLAGFPETGPGEGDMDRVEQVIIEHGIQLLVLSKWPCQEYTACEFTKLKGDKAEPCEEEFKMLLKRSKIQKRVDA